MCVIIVATHHHPHPIPFQQGDHTKRCRVSLRSPLQPPTSSYRTRTHLRLQCRGCAHHTRNIALHKVFLALLHGGLVDQDARKAVFNCHVICGVKVALSVCERAGVSRACLTTATGSCLYVCPNLHCCFVSERNSSAISSVFFFHGMV